MSQHRPDRPVVSIFEPVVRTPQGPAREILPGPPPRQILLRIVDGNPLGLRDGGESALGRRHLLLGGSGLGSSG